MDTPTRGRHYDIVGSEIDDSEGWEDKLLGLASWKGTVRSVYFEGDMTQLGRIHVAAAGAHGSLHRSLHLLPAAWHRG